MSLFDIFRKREKEKIVNTEVEQKGLDTYMTPEAISKLLEGGDISDLTTRQLTQSHSWVYACINAISSSASRVPLKVVKRENNSWVILERDNPYVQLVEDINGFQFQQEFIEGIIQRLCSKGVCFVEISRGKNKKPVALYIIDIDPANVEFTLNKTGDIISYTFSLSSGNKVTMKASDILYFRLPHPYDVYKGLSPLQALEQGILADYYAQRYNKAFFKNGATLRGTLSTTKGLSNRAWIRLQDIWKSLYSGIENQHKVLILEEGLTYTPITVSPKDMDFVSLRKFSREEILAGYRVYPVVLGITEQVSQSNASIQFQLFYEETLSFYLVKIASVLTHFLRRESLDTSLKVVFDLTQVPALNTNFAGIINWATKATNSGIMKINDIRDLLGMSRLPWGDSWWANSAMIELAKDTTGGETNPPKSSNISSLTQPEIKGYPKIVGFKNEYMIGYKLNLLGDNK